MQNTSLGDLDSYIAQLDIYIRDLKQQADAFIKATNSGNYMGLSKKLFGIGESDATFSGCAKRTLSDARFVRGLQALEYNYEAIFKSMSQPLQKQITKKIDADVVEKISHGTLTKTIEDIFVSSLIKNKTINSAAKQAEVLKKLGYEGELPKRVLTSAKGEVREYAKRLSEQLIVKSNQSLSKEIEQLYKKVFQLNWDAMNVITPLSSDELNKELTRLSAAVGERLSKEILASLANILGSTGEAGLSVIHEATSSGIEIVVTGDKTEAEVAKLMSTIVSGEVKDIEKYYLKSTHHDLTKQSQTDLILTAKGVSVKAQAKNALLQAMKETLEKNGYDYDHTMWYTRLMDQDRKLTELLDILTGDNNNHYRVLTDQDASTIAYLLANAAWFHYAGSVSEKHKKAVSKVDNLSGINGVIGLAEKLLAVSIKDFVGLEITGDGLSVDASNIFYLIGNRVAFPTYLILEEYKEQLLGVRAELFQMRYIMSPLSGLSPSNAEDYRENILASLGNIPPSRGRIGLDSEEGFEMGKNILSQLTGHINFRFNIAKQLGKISYKF